MAGTTKHHRFYLACCAILAHLGGLALASAASTKIKDATPFLNELNGVVNNLLALSNTSAYITKTTVPDVIAKEGYPVEVHHVTTADGYILELHRIPYGRKCGPGAGKRVAFIQHGLLCDSSNWIMNGPDKSLGFLLADDCFDVWLGNARGNYYSKNHVVFDPVKHKEQFWAYSFHEMGIYDLPANFDYVLNKTGADGLYYAGHSMGTTMFWICMSERPEYNDKIKLMSALAPVAYTASMISPIRLIAPFAAEMKWLLRMFGQHEFLPSSEFLELIGELICKETNPLQPLCSNVLFLLCGFNPDQVDPALMPILLQHLPAGQSVSTVVHYAQGYNTKDFRQFDFGRKENVLRYGQAVPPKYDLSKITAPVVFYWGENDWLGASTDTHRLAELIPNIQKKFRVPHDKFNHLDFLIAKDVHTYLYNYVREFMSHF